MKKDSAGAGDTLTVRVHRGCRLKDKCPVYQVNNGGVFERVIRPGDTVRLDQDSSRIHRVTNVTTDYGPHLGRFSMGGESKLLAAAMLVLDNNSVIYVSSIVEKICPVCQETVTDFNY